VLWGASFNNVEQKQDTFEGDALMSRLDVVIVGILLKGARESSPSGMVGMLIYREEK
jgi:hypothetical protein